MSDYILFLLLADSAYVAYRLYKKRNAWHFIVLYWIILATYNAVKVIERFA